MCQQSYGRGCRLCEGQHIALSLLGGVFFYGPLARVMGPIHRFKTHAHTCIYVQTLHPPPSPTLPPCKPFPPTPPPRELLPALSLINHCSPLSEVSASFFAFSPALCVVPCLNGILHLLSERCGPDHRAFSILSIIYCK